MVADEIQSGLARTGRTFACDLEDVVPDVYVLGKALGGGLYPVSAVAADRDVMEVFTPGSHGSTFGGNPLAAAIGREVVAMLRTGEFQERAARLGQVMEQGLRALVGHGVLEVRCRGLWAGVDVDPALMSGRQLCEALLRRGVLTRETHGSTIRLAPPLVATESDIEHLVDALKGAITDVVPRLGRRGRAERAEHHVAAGLAGPGVTSYRSKPGKSPGQRSGDGSWPHCPLGHADLAWRRWKGASDGRHGRGAAQASSPPSEWQEACCRRSSTRSTWWRSSSRSSCSSPTRR